MVTRSDSCVRSTVSGRTDAAAVLYPKLSFCLATGVPFPCCFAIPCLTLGVCVWLR